MMLSQNDKRDTGVGMVEIAVLGQKGKTTQQLTTTPGSALKLFTGNDFPDASLMTKEMQLMLYRRLYGPSRAAGPVPMDQGQHLEALARGSPDFRLHPSQGLAHQRPALLQIDHAVDRPGPLRRLNSTCSLAVRTGGFHPLDFIAAHAAKHEPHLSVTLFAE
jgi:hypothetical protein